MYAMTFAAALFTIGSVTLRLARVHGDACRDVGELAMEVVDEVGTEVGTWGNDGVVEVVVVTRGGLAARPLGAPPHAVTAIATDMNPATTDIDRWLTRLTVPCPRQPA